MSASHGQVTRQPYTSAVVWRPLAPGAPLAFRRSICLHARLASSGCRACAETCPVGALGFSSEGLVLHAGCTGCGRCASACPAGALAAAGFAEAFAADAASAAAALVLECARVDRATSIGAVRVPCLGGISAGRLLALCAGEPTRPVVLVDRGSCGACDSGGASHPAAATVECVSEWMREAGVPDAMLPRLERRSEGALSSTADPMQSRGRARRGFFGVLARPAREQTRAPSEAADVTPRRMALDALQSLAARHGGRVPTALFHRVEVGAACRGLRICASACPSGALARWRDEAAGTVGLSFDPADCTGCAHCAAVCPQQAVRVLPATTAGRGRHFLTRHAQTACVDCGARFAVAPGEEETRCQRCRRSAQFARSAFDTLFFSRPTDSRPESS